MGTNGHRRCIFARHLLGDGGGGGGGVMNGIIPVYTMAIWIAVDGEKMVGISFGGLEAAPTAHSWRPRGISVLG